MKKRSPIVEYLRKHWLALVFIFVLVVVALGIAIAVQDIFSTWFEAFISSVPPGAFALYAFIILFFFAISYIWLKINSFKNKEKTWHDWFSKLFDTVIFPILVGVIVLSSTGIIRDFSEINKKLTESRNLEKGREFYSQGKYSEAFAKWKPLAEKEEGSKQAQYELAILYRNENWDKADIDEAFKLLEKAAKQGHVVAQYQLGILHLDNIRKKTVEAFEKAAASDHESTQFRLDLTHEYRAESDRAIKWLSKAAEEDHALAQLELGLIYRDGIYKNGIEVIAKNIEEAIKWYKKTAGKKNKNKYGQFKLCEIYFIDEYGSQNYDEAFYWCKKAADQGIVSAQLYIGTMYYKGEIDKENGSPNYGEAKSWYEKAARQGLAEAQYNLGNMYYKGEIVKADGSKDYEEAKRWFEDAAEQKHVEAQFNLGLMYYKGEASFFPDYTKAKELFTEAAEGKNGEQGHAVAQYYLGNMYYEGKIVKEDGSKDYDEAFQWYIRSAELGYAVAQYHLGVIYLDVKNYEEAFKWLIKAAKQEYVVAQITLANIYKDGLGDISPNNITAYIWASIVIDNGHEETKEMLQILEKEMNPEQITRAQNNLGILYEFGVNVIENYDKAIKWYGKAAGRGYVYAQNSLGDLYYRGKVGGTPNYEEAFKWYGEAAEKGYAAAQNNLGNMYYRGEVGDAPNHKEAFKWYEKGAKQAHAKAQTNLGRMYYKGEGTTKDYIYAYALAVIAINIGNEEAKKTKELLTDLEQNNEKTKKLLTDLEQNTEKAKELLEDLKQEMNHEEITQAQYHVGNDYYEVKNYKEALKWFKKAVAEGENGEQGNARAQNHLAYMYENGEGVDEKDIEEAIKWFKKAANQGYALAQTNLGVIYLYYENKGILEDPDEAFYWLNKAAEQGHARAQYYLALMYAKGEGVPQNYDEAIKLYKKAAEQGYAAAQYNLGNIYYYGRTGIPKNLTDAFKWYKKAAEQGNAKAQNDIGYMYLNGEGVDENIEEAFKWYLKAAEQGHVRAQYTVGIMYEHGRGVEENDAEAFKWYSKAAAEGKNGEQGYAPAQTNLGYLYVRGEGVDEKDIEEAIKWFSKAAKQGDATAQYNLGVLYGNGKGVPQNYIKAYMWSYIAKSNGDKDAEGLLENLKNEMNSEQISEAEDMAKRCKESKYEYCGEEDKLPPTFEQYKVTPSSSDIYI